jgi:hypothetical protein
MDSPDARLARLVTQAKKVLESSEGTISDLALSLAHSVLEHAEVSTEEPPPGPSKFSFKLDDEKPNSKTVTSP